MKRLAAALLLAALAGPALAACPDDASIERFTTAWKAKQPTEPLNLGGSLADAACARDKFVARIAAGRKLVGYKAALTAKPVQERFGASAPVLGILTDEMLLPSPAKVPARYGARPVWEADLLLVVRSQAIMQAKTGADISREISAMRPFIELPDLVVDANAKMDFTVLAAINAGARLGVMGEEIALPTGQDLTQMLAELKITALDAEGKPVAQNTGAATLGSPINAVLWLVEALRAEGKALKAGDLISVGSFSPLTPPKPGERFTVRYEGAPLNSPAEVSVAFE